MTDTARKPAPPFTALFPERWSRRAFADRAVDPQTLHQLFEAARWAPSCFNEQPWLFVYARTAADLERFRPLLVDKNRRWADRAPVLAFAFARRHFDRNQSPNPWAKFDTGAAWMSLALQAHMLGLSAHGMGGIHYDRVYEALGVPADRFDAICGIAIGYPGDPATLPADLRLREAPSDRRAQGAFAHQGRFSLGGPND
jgi:nitroreductase